MKSRLLIPSLISLSILLFGAANVFSQDIADYLILQDIGQFKLDKPEKMLPGEPPMGGPRTYEGDSAVASSGHFPDHIDKSYEVMYLGGEANASPTVKVAQHSGGDFDQWLRHELERDFRNYFGLPGDSYVTRQIDGNNILAAGSGGWHYRWLSGNKVISIEYTDLQMEKQEPLDVVKAYLAKHPSTLTPVTSADLRTSDNKTKWIKGEMERRLWLCDKWFMALQLEKAAVDEVAKESVDHMIVFLDYREKYYGVSANDEKQALWVALSRKDNTSIKNKLEVYKTWWAANKGEEISL